MGDFLAAASEHIDAAAHDFPELPAEAAPAVLNQLSRLTTVMTRCADAFVTEDRTDPAYLLDAQELAVRDARPALRHAAARTRTTAGALGHNSDNAQHPAATCLARATACLAAGHDLLQTHFAPGQPGPRHETSLWAPAIASAPVNAALVTAMGGYAGRLAPWTLQLAATPSCVSLPAPTRVAISAACRWLRIAEAAAWTVRARPGATADQALLYAIPVNIPPPRRSPHGDERIPGLCAGAVATAERLRHLAHAPANRTGTAQTGLAAAWHRTAQGAAITGHCTELILRQLAESAAELPISVTASALKEAAHATSAAWAAWRTVAHKWDIFTTSPGATPTPVAATIGDLTLWAGRLAYTDPAWTPARNHTSPARTTTAFTSEAGTIAGLVSALHQIGNALAHVAAHDRDNVRSAAANGDLYVPTRPLPAECDMPYRWKQRPQPWRTLC